MPRESPLGQGEYPTVLSPGRAEQQHPEKEIRDESGQRLSSGHPKNLLIICMTSGLLTLPPTAGVGVSGESHW